MLQREEESDELVGNNGSFRKTKLKQTLLKTLNWKEVIARDILGEMVNDSIESSE